MNILAIETACEQGSVALMHNGELLARRIEGAANHSEAVLRDVRALLAEAGLAAAQLNAVAFGAGPGAFTGLRLACGVAQGIALAAGLGVAPVCSLQAMALDAGAARVLVANDARMGEIYYAAYQRDADGVPHGVAAPACASPDTLVLPPGQWLGMGSAFKAWPELAGQLGAALSGCDPERLPRAEDVARLGALMAGAGALVAPELAAPLYVRDKVAFTTAERLARGGRA